MAATETTVAFLGAGTMGEALLKGSLDGGLNAGDTWVTARSRERLDTLVGTYGVHATTDNAEAAAQADVVVVAVPPQHARDVVREVAGRLRADATVICIADGVTLAELQQIVPSGVAVVRAMPNLAAQVGKGLTLLTMGPGRTDEQAHKTVTFLHRSGEVTEVAEDQQAVLAPLSSGGLAYFFYLADAMIEAGAVRGIPRETARELITQTMAGSTAWLQHSTEDPAGLRAKVCAPGGAGIKRVAELDARAVRAAIVAALTKSV